MIGKSSISGIIMVLLFSLQSCIENDIPYPTIKAEILAIDMDGMISAKFDEEAQTITVKVADTLDLKDIRIKKLEITKEAKVIPDSLSCIDFVHFPDSSFMSADSLPKTANTRMNFKKPVSFLLRTYQDYVWTVNVQHDITFLIKVKNQSGSPVIDELNKQVIIYVDEDLQPKFDNIEIEEFRLGSSIATVFPLPNTVKDFRRPQKIDVMAFGDTVTWTVSVLHPSADDISAKLSVWAKRVYLSGGSKNGSVSIQYRKKGEETWESVLSNEITINEGSYLAMMTHLQPETSYEYQITIDGKEEGLKEFTTDVAQQIPNLSFDDWYKEGKTWYADLDLSEANYWWDSGNKGSNTVGEVNPTLPEEKDTKQNKAARLASTSVAGVFAAGSLYTGSFGKVEGLSGASLNFGKPYTARPSKLKGFYKYTSGKVTHTKRDEVKIDDADSCHIYIGLFNWTKPFPVSTSEGNFVDLSWNNPDMLAFGEFKSNQSIKDYEPLNIELKYRDYFTKPTYILIVASSSKYGDYFTGSTSSILLLDEFELVFE